VIVHANDEAALHQPEPVIVQHQHRALHGGNDRHGEQLHQSDQDRVRVDRLDERDGYVEQGGLELDHEAGDQLRHLADHESGGGGVGRSGGDDQLGGDPDRQQRSYGLADLHCHLHRGLAVFLIRWVYVRHLSV
jgi:hypothetical protein